ncbi:hypothetical protein HY970_03875 [Candidatus Kaiserbacteria bacterium]|nr:hypothetical protein [Candidatus Kaiserbacteria bacterium]
MTNLIPLEAQKDLWQEYRARFIITLSVFLIALALLALVVLVPSFIALEVMSPRGESAQLIRANDSEVALLSRVQGIVLQIGPVLSSTSSATSVIRAALAQKPNRVSIDHIVYTRGGDTPQLILSGSGSRSVVSEYRNALLLLNRFTSVSIPVGALVGSADGNFSMTLGGTF